MSPKTILVPIDFSECSNDLVLKAVQMADAPGDRLVLLHVSERPHGLSLAARVNPDGSQEQSVHDFLDGAAGARLDAFVAVAEGAGAQARGLVRQGEAASIILEVANDLGVDAIVMGTHGRTGLARLTLGSVAETVSQRAICPVTTVRTQRKKSCAAKSCAWCASNVTPELAALRAETDG